MPSGKMSRAYWFFRKKICQISYCSTELLFISVAWWPGWEEGGSGLPVTIFRGAKIRNFQCEILYKICNIQLVNKLKDTSNSGISIAIQLSNSFWEGVHCYHF